MPSRRGDHWGKTWNGHAERRRSPGEWRRNVKGEFSRALGGKPHGGSPCGLMVGRRRGCVRVEGIFSRTPRCKCHACKAPGHFFGWHGCEFHHSGPNSFFCMQCLPKALGDPLTSDKQALVGPGRPARRPIARTGPPCAPMAWPHGPYRPARRPKGLQAHPAPPGRPGAPSGAPWPGAPVAYSAPSGDGAGAPWPTSPPRSSPRSSCCKPTPKLIKRTLKLIKRAPVSRKHTRK